MVASIAALRVGILGPEETTGKESRGCALWETGYAAAVRMAGGEPVLLGATAAGRPWRNVLEGLHALIWTGRFPTAPPCEKEDDPSLFEETAAFFAQPRAEEIRLGTWCRKNRFPLLAVDDALHVLNVVYGGTVHLDLCRERPEALQHRHPPEPGVRHAICIRRGSKLARIYGEGEVVVNSEHRRAICRVAQGFHASAQALDGIIEAIEADAEDWFATGVQWRPAATSASGLDIQLFRGLIDAARGRLPATTRRPRLACSSAA